MLFDRANALKGVIDFLPEANDVLNLLSEVIEIASYRFQFRVDRRQFFSDDRAHILLRCHTIDDERQHFAEFLKRRLFCRCHMRQVYHSVPYGKSRATK